jgi:tetratricopeptide (TPR) repeat protein
MMALFSLHRFLPRAALTALALAVLLTNTAMAEPVAVRAAPHDNYGRIVFNFAVPSMHTATIQGRRLVVQFQKPIEANYGSLVRVLGKYISRVATGADGRSAVFTLKGDFSLRSFDQGSAVVVDVMDASPAQAEKADQTAAATPTTTPATAPAGDGPRIPVRVGQHEQYSRIVFDWPRSVKYSLKQDAGNVTITFARQARIQLGRLGSRPPKFMSGAATATGANDATVTLKVAETSRVRHFLSGPKVVVDVMAPSAPTQTAAKTEKPAAPAAKPKPAAPAAKPNPATPAAKPKPAAPAVKAETAAPAAKPQTTQAAKPQTAPVAKPQTAPASKPQTAAAKPTPLAPKKEAALTPPKPAAAPNPAAGSTPTAATDPAAAAPAPKPAPLTPVTRKAVLDQVKAFSLRFDWEEPVAAAVFRRAGFLWVAFDKRKTIDTNALKAASGNAIQGAEQLATEFGTVLRLALPPNINPSIKRDSLAWILELDKRPLRAVTPVEMKSQPNSPVGARLFLPVPEPGKAIAVTDPEVGDSLVIVPIIPLGHGVTKTLSFPEVRVPPTGQGVVIQPLVDDLRVRPLRQGIELTSASSLHISQVTAQAAAGTKLAVKKPLTRTLDLDKWRHADIETFVDNRQELAKTISKSKGKARETARLDLARFYFCHGMQHEAIGVLKRISQERPEIGKEPEFRALRGASNFLMERYAESVKDLQHASLDAIDEGLFWRAALKAATEDMAGASDELKRTGSLIRKYPKPVMMPLGLLIAESAIEVGDIKQAAHYLEVLNVNEPNLVQKNQIDYTHGRLLELSGDFDTAIEKWEEVQDGKHRPSQAKATLLRAELLLKLRRMTRAEVINEMENLRFAWRGDDFEFSILHRLGRLYLEEKGFREGLRTLKQAATYFRKHEKAPRITEEMTSTFAKLYLDGAADVLPPVTAIALYDEFKELTPVGAKGDEMIRKLADRLVGVDLLDRAAKLLDNQVRFRLKGVERARVGAQLALVHILDRKPKEAMEALKVSDSAGLPPTLSAQRRQLSARVMMGLDREEEALETVKDDKGVDADLLRAEIYWGNQDWRNASQVLRNLVMEFQAKPRQPLDERQSLHVLSLAIALTLSGNERALQRVRRDYGDAMEQGTFKDAFRLISRPQAEGLLDYRVMPANVADAANFITFMSAYRERLRKNNLSAVN